jgi:hypothetical protein
MNHEIKTIGKSDKFQAVCQSQSRQQTAWPKQAYQCPSGSYSHCVPEEMLIPARVAATPSVPASGPGAEAGGWVPSMGASVGGGRTKTSKSSRKLPPRELRSFDARMNSPRIVNRLSCERKQGKGGIKTKNEIRKKARHTSRSRRRGRGCGRARRGLRCTGARGRLAPQRGSRAASPCSPGRKCGHGKWEEIGKKWIGK